MNKNYHRLFWQIIFLLFLQVFLFNQISFRGYITPYVYILTILLLPASINRIVLLFLGFLFGATIDQFSNTSGIHAAASTFLAFMRPFIIKLLSKNSDAELNTPITLVDKGVNWFMIYVAIAVILHHSILLFLEVFTFSNFLGLSLRVVQSSIVSFITIIIVVLLFKKEKKSRIND